MGSHLAQGDREFIFWAFLYERERCSISSIANIRKIKVQARILGNVRSVRFVKSVYFVQIESRALFPCIFKPDPPEAEERA